MKAFIKSHASLGTIIIAAILVELTSAVMYYSAQGIIHRTVEKLVDREMNAIYLCIRNKLTKVEVTVDNMAWVVTDGLEEPEWMFDISQRMVKNNPSFWGSGIAFIPNYYPNEDKFFEPYAVRRGQDSIVSIQLGSDGVDHTQDEYFRVPVTTGKAHWSEPYPDMNGAQKIITTYGVPIRNEKNSIAGIVYADISLDWLDEIMEEAKLYKSTQRFLVTGSGHLLAGTDNALFQTALERMKVDSDKVGNFTIDDEEGEKHHVFFHPVGGNTNWILISILNDRDMFSKLSIIRAKLMLMVLTGLLLIGFIVWRTSRNLERLRKVNAEKERIGGELRVANQIQQNMLPHQQIQQDDVDIFGSLVPAREVGGDLYDYYIRDEKLFFCIGDVSGKGAASAMLMAVIHSLFRAFSSHDSNPAHIMQNVNIASCEGNDTNMFVTLFIGVLDLPTGKLRYCNAGHDAPIIMGKDILPLEVKANLPVGVFNDVGYTVQDALLLPGTTIFLYTDGLTEAMRSDNKMFGMKRVMEALASCSQFHPQQLLEAISQQVHLFVGNAEQSDDLTMLAIRYTPKIFESTLSETLVIKNNIKEVSRFSTFIKTLLENMDVEKSLARQLRLAVEEAVVNVIDYAYPAGTEGNIEIRMMYDGQTLRFQIIDAGVAFDPTAKEKTDTSLSAEDRQIGGLGILLVREIMDTINYERVEGKNKLMLTKKLNSKIIK